MRNTHCRMNALGAALLGLGLALGATAQTSSSTPISPKPGTAAGRMTVTSEASTDKLAGTDKAFVEKAAMGGVAEVELGKLAQQKAANDQVKQFGARMDSTRRRRVQEGSR